MKIKSYICAFSIMVVAMAGSAFALGELGTGTGGLSKWIHPRIGVGVDYDDNIFLTPSGEKADTIFKVNPGFLVSVPFAGGTHVASLDYSLEAAVFSKFDNQNYANQNGTLNLDLNLPKFTVRANDNFRPTSSRSGTEFTSRIERFENLSSLSIASQEINNLSVILNYSLFSVAYRDDAQKSLNRVDHTVGATLAYQLFPKTKSIVEYNQSFYGYSASSSRDGDNYDVRLGLTGELLPKLVGTVKGGYQKREYKTSTQNWSSATYFGSLTHNLSPRTSFVFSFERGARESSYSTNNFYTYDQGSLSASQKLFWDRLSMNINGSLQNNDYPIATTEVGITQSRSDKIYGAGIGFDYGIQQWLTTGISYNYSNRNSNFDGFDYVSNSIGWKISATF